MEKYKDFGLTDNELLSLMLNVKKLLNKDIGSNVQILVPITEEDASIFNLTKEQLAIITHDYIIRSHSGQYTFVRYDQDWNILIDLSDFQILGRKAIREIKACDFDTYVYLDEYKLLLIGSSDGIDATISDVEPDQVEEAVLMVASLAGSYGVITGNFDTLEECYWGPRD